MGKTLAYRARPASAKTLAHLSRVRKKLDSGVAASNALYNSYRSVSAKRGYDWELSKEQFLNLTKQECFYCGNLPLGLKKSQDNSGDYPFNGVDRVDNDRGYTLDNSVPCCKICNVAKNSQSLDEFKSWVARVNKRINK